MKPKNPKHLYKLTYQAGQFRLLGKVEYVLHQACAADRKPEPAQPYVTMGEQPQCRMIPLLH